MTEIKRKEPSKSTRNKISSVEDEEKISKVINQGGKTACESINSDSDEIRFTLRIPKRLVKIIDSQRKGRLGNISRNQWIIEALMKFSKFK